MTEIFSPKKSKHSEKEIRIQDNGKQFSIRIPTLFAEAIGIEKRNKKEGEAPQIVILKYNKDNKEITIKLKE